MDSDDPDLQAFESNLRRILRERELGKAAALAPNLCPNASDPQSIGVSRIPLWHIISLRFGVFAGWSRNILRIEVRMAYLFFCWPLVLREDLWRRTRGSSGGGGGAIFTNCSCSCPSRGNFLQFGGRTRQGIVETADTRLCTGKIGEPTTVEKMDWSSCVGMGKDPGRHSVARKVYIWHKGKKWSQEYKQISKIRKQTAWSYWRSQISTQKIEVETLRNNSTIEIDQRRHRGKYLLLEELRSAWDLWITSHESDCR